MTFQEFQEKFRINELKIYSNDFWHISLRPGQLTLGSMVISTSKEWKNFTDVSEEAGAGLIQAQAICEKLAKETFGAVRINVVCLMMNDPFIHYHVLPRFDKDVSFAELKWKDEFWPGAPVFKPVITDDLLLSKLKEEYLNNL